MIDHLRNEDIRKYLKVPSVIDRIKITDRIGSLIPTEVLISTVNTRIAKYRPAFGCEGSWETLETMVKDSVKLAVSYTHLCNINK